MSAIKNMPDGTERQREAKAKLLARAQAVSLDENATEKQVEKAERD